MARRRNSDPIAKLLVVAVITLVGFLFRFLGEVHRMRLWGAFFKSLFVVFLYCGVVAGVAQSSEEVAGVLGLGGLIYFCYWWHKKFNYVDTRLNSAYWRERQWWWTLDGWQFEQEVARVFRLNGYNAEVTKGSGDGGVDIILRKGGYKAIVQCKHYQKPLSPDAMRALWGVKDDYGADEVIMVASAGLTSASAEFVRNKPSFKVYNLDDIIRMSEYPQYTSEAVYEKVEEKEIAKEEPAPQELKPEPVQQLEPKPSVDIDDPVMGRTLDI